MREIKGIGWDDRYFTDNLKYFSKLNKELNNRHGIVLEVESKSDEFRNAFTANGKLDFVVLDLMDESTKPVKFYAGYELALWIRQTRPDIPIFIITQDISYIVMKEVIPAQPFFFFSKELSVESVAIYIVEVLKHIGISKERNRVFIGHGGNSKEWEKLKEKIKLAKIPFAEFNEPDADDSSVIQRLVTMKNQSAVAILVFTGEDERKDGKFNARLNVIHEAGFFQSFLGFEKVLILLEDGCEFFSNNSGIIVKKFPKGEIEKAFPRVNRFLEINGYELLKI